MDAQQDVTLGEIYRSVQRIESNVNGLMVQHAETRVELADQRSRLANIEHYTNNLKHLERLKAQMPEPAIALSGKALFGWLVAAGSAVGGAVAAYFKATGN